jgi:aryl-alcohol dehydrogenase-like predicted oxidoreductase
MQYRQLGNSKLQVSTIGFGCMSLKDNETGNTRLLHEAVEKGINFFDTADLYENGLNERMVGKILKDKRDKIILATKVGNQWHSDTTGELIQPPVWNAHKEYIIKAVEESLIRLQTDHIDLYQLHGGTLEDPMDETIEAFELLQQQGKIRYYGISSIRPAVIREYVRRSRIVSVMMQYSLMDRRPEETCLDLLQKDGISVLTRGSLAKGLLVDKPATGYLNYGKEEVRRAAQAIRSLSGAHRGPAQTALQFVLYHPAIAAAIIGLRTIEQFEDGVKTLATPTLTEKEMHYLQQSISLNYYEQHR